MTTANPQVDAAQPLQFSGRRKLPLIMQSEATECGLACLAMVAGYHGYEIDLISIRQQFSVSSHGATLKQIMSMADSLGLSCRAVRLELSDLPHLQTPCILHWEMNHFVVLKKVRKGHVVIHDPAIGERCLPLTQVDKLFTGIALELVPTPAFVRGEKKLTLRLSHFWRRITGLKRSLVIILLLSLALQVFAVISPYYMQLVIDEVILRSDHNLLTVLALGFALLLCVEVFTSTIRQFVILNLSSRLSLQMAANVFSHLVRLPLDYFAKRHIGDLVSRFGSMHHIRELLTTGVVQVLVDGLMALITLLVMYLYAPMLTLLVIVIVALYAALRAFFYVPVRRLTEEGLIASAKEQSHFMESMRAIQTIKLFERESDRQNEWQNRLTGVLNNDIRLTRWNIGFDGCSKLLFGVENLLVIYFAAGLVMDNVLSVGMLYAFISYKSRFVTAMDSLIDKWIEFKMLNVHFDRLADMVFTAQDPLSAKHKHLQGYAQFPSPVITHAIDGNLSAQKLSFRYSRLDNPVFCDVHLTVCAGQTLAIVGPSGAGKSTLLKCLMGLFEPDDGSIMIDNQPLKRCPQYRQQIAAVMQDDQLLSGSIADNIACFEPTPDLEQVIMVAHIACIHGEIMGMAMQYNTLVGEMGCSLSGGQKQRILLARALYKKPRILFLDEATSHLDLANEERVNQHIKKLSITRIIIAHRPHTISMADCVVRLEQGQLRDVTHDSTSCHSVNKGD